MKPDRYKTAGIKGGRGRGKVVDPNKDILREDAWIYSYAMDGPKLVGVTMSNIYDVV